MVVSRVVRSISALLASAHSAVAMPGQLVSYDASGSTRKPFGEFEIGAAIADHGGLCAIQVVAGQEPGQQARARFAALAAVFFQVWTNERLLERNPLRLEQRDDVLVAGFELLEWK